MDLHIKLSGSKIFVGSELLKIKNEIESLSEVKSFCEHDALAIQIEREEQKRLIGLV